MVVATLEILSGRSKKEYAKEAEAVADAPDCAQAPTAASAESDLKFARRTAAVGRHSRAVLLTFGRHCP